MPGSLDGFPSLLLLADGRLPTGGHANSAGVEWASPHDDLSDPAKLAPWIASRMRNVGFVEAAFAVAAGASVSDQDAVSDAKLDVELSARLVGPRARAVSRQMGRQFDRLARRLQPEATPRWAGQADGPHYALALGATAGAYGLGATAIASLVLHHQVASAITAVIRLHAADPIELAVVHAQMGDEIIDIAQLAPGWAEAHPSDLPSNSMALAEILAEDHGCWDSRLFVA